MNIDWLDIFRKLLMKVNWWWKLIDEESQLVKKVD